MKIQTCDIPNNIALVDTATFFGPSLIINYSAYAEFPADTFQTYYDELEHNQIKSVPPCKVSITDFYPKEVAGGIKDTLTIKVSNLEQLEEMEIFISKMLTIVGLQKFF